MTIEPGAIIAGKYRLDELLGQGGMGTVWRATHVGLAESVALKVVDLPPGSESTQSTFLKRFEREARVAFQLRHDNAVQVLDFGEDEGAPYLVMEYLEGRPLSDDLEAGGRIAPVERVVALAAQLADVLVEMHRQSLVHRDLKPQNVVLLEDPEVEGGERPVLVDFGLAYLADSETLGRVTQGGEVLGTPYYMAPEQGRGAADIGPPADVYAFGCLLFEMVTGTVLFDGNSATEIVGKQVYSPAPAMSDRLDPAGLEAGEREMFGRMEELVGAMLAKEVDDRPTAEEVRETCQAILGGEPEWPRGRPPKFLQARSERAVGGAEGGGLAARAPGGGATVGVVGEVDEDWYVGLGSSDIGCRAIEGPEGADGVDIFFVVEADAEQVERYAEYGPVLVGSDPADFEATRRMLQAGASDMVPRPVTSAKLVEKVERLWRKVQRGRSS